MSSQLQRRQSTTDEVESPDEDFRPEQTGIGNAGMLELLGLSGASPEAQGGQQEGLLGLFGGGALTNDLGVPVSGPSGPAPGPGVPGGGIEPWWPKLPFPNGPTGLGGPAAGVGSGAGAGAGAAAAEQGAAQVVPRVALGLGVAGAVVAAGFVAGLAAPFIIGGMIDRAAEVDQETDPDLKSLPGGAPPQVVVGPDGDAGAPTQAPGTSTDKSNDPQPGGGTDPLDTAPKDKWYGYNDRQFQAWYHRCFKRPGDPDGDKDTIGEAYDQWVSEGKPTSDSC